jgi:hypothetical protein
MIRAASLQLVDAAELPVYPIDRGTRLDGHAFLKWFHHRWLNSRMHLTASYEVQGMAFALFNIAQNQSPLGTLPDDDLELAALLRLDLPRWQEARARKMGPLHNWAPCLCDAEIRLMHPVVLEMALDALERRESRALSKEEAAERQRVKRLRENLAEIGVSQAVLADGILIGRMEAWLTANWKGNRTRKAYDAVMVEAARAGWWGGET